MNGNTLANNLAQDLESTMSPEIGAVISPAPPPPTAPLSIPFSGFDPPPQHRPSRAEQQRAQQTSAPPSASLRKFGTMAKMFPGAEKVRVSKRSTSGGLGPIGEWSLRDIARTGDMLSFMLEFVRPTWKGGSYHFEIGDARGVWVDGGAIELPEVPGGGSASYGGSESVSHALIDQIARLENKVTAPPLPPPDPIENFKRMKETLDSMKEPNTAGDSNAMVLSMMQMMMQQTMRPADAELRAELAALKAQLAAPPSMPMPPPPAEPTMHPALAGLLGAFTAAVPSLIERVMAKPAPDPNALTTRDIIALLQSNKNDKSELEIMRESLVFFKSMAGETKQETLTEKLQEMNALKELAENITGGGAAPNANFFDALGALFSNKSFADSLGKVFGQEVNARRNVAPAPVVQPTQAPQLSGPAQQTPAAPPPPAKPRLVLPDDMREFCERIEKAADDETRVRATIEALYHLRSIEQWAPVVDDLIHSAATNQRERAMQLLSGWFGFLVSNKMLEHAAGSTAIKSFHEQWPAVHATIAKMLNMPVLEMPAGAPTAGAQPEVPPIAPADAVEKIEADGEDEDEEEEEEDESDE